MSERQTDKSREISGGREQTQWRVLSAALRLLNEGGRDAVTTRAVAELAGVQPPVLYRLFGDKEGLLNALAEHGYTLYLEQKQSKDRSHDPVEALRSGWDRHVQFGLSHPSLYMLMYAQPQMATSPAAELSFAMLHSHMNRVAAAGRLRMSEDRAVAMFHAAALGVVITLLRVEVDARDPMVSIMARDHTLSIIATTHDVRADQSPVSAAAATLRAAVKAEDGFSLGELAVFREWLGRVESR